MTRLGTAAFAIGLALGVLPATAAAQSATPATLTGETLTASRSVDASPYPFFLPCGGGSTSAPDFSFDGTAAGPYPGTFTETGKVVWDAVVPGPNGDGGPVTSYSSTFSITGQHATVTGSETLTDTGGEATCWGSAGGAGVDIRRVVATYSATITTAAGTYHDHGKSTVNLGQSFGLGQDWSGYLNEAFTPAPASVTPPTVAGTATEGQPLAESHGTWTGSPSSYTHRWERCDASGGDCTVITGATQQTYTLSSADLGSTIRVKEWATNDGGTSGPVTSAASPMVQAAAPSPSPASSTGTPPGQGVTPPSALGGSTPSAPAAPIKLRVTYPRAISIAVLLRHDGYRWTVKAPRPGRVVVAWYRGGKLLALGDDRFKKAGRVSVRIRLTATGRRLLRHVRSLRLTMRTTYTPTGGTAVSASRSLALRR
jgi:hypothetical protein